MRSDHGPEFIARVIRDWCQRSAYKRPMSILVVPGRMDGLKVFIAAFAKSFLIEKLFFGWPKRKSLSRTFDAFITRIVLHSSLDHKTPDDFCPSRETGIRQNATTLTSHVIQLLDPLNRILPLHPAYHHIQALQTSPPFLNPDSPRAILMGKSGNLDRLKLALLSGMS